MRMAGEIPGELLLGVDGGGTRCRARLGAALSEAE
jgi:N-acetylglucosamine kinase-like BadF-type ATPase